MEKRNSKRLPLLAAIIAVLLSITGLVGGTLALFTGEANVSNNVLQAGNLKATLERTALQATYLDADGVLQAGQNVADSPYVDFTNVSLTDGDKNVFGLTEDDVIVPCSEYVATMLLSNKGSVAFTFTASLEILDTDSKELSKQLTIQLLDMNGNEISNGVVNAGKAVQFKVVLKFNDLTTNNSVMDAGTKINLKISCTQKVNV